MSVFTHHLLFDHFQFVLIHGPNIPGSYAILFFIASNLTSITSHIHSWELFLLWLHPFILSGVVSPLISSSISNWMLMFIGHLPTWGVHLSVSFLPFYTVHGVTLDKSIGTHVWGGITKINTKMPDFKI